MSLVLFLRPIHVRTDLFCYPIPAFHSLLFRSSCFSCYSFYSSPYSISFPAIFSFFLLLYLFPFRSHCLPLSLLLHLLSTILFRPIYPDHSLSLRLAADAVTSFADASFPFSFAHASTHAEAVYIPTTAFPHTALLQHSSAHRALFPPPASRGSSSPT